MYLSVSLSLTPKGMDEVLNRAYKLNIRQRSVLLLLGKSQALEHILQKLQIFYQEEIFDVINDLADQGFVAVSGGTIPRTSVPGGNIQLIKGIIVTEAKFLLIDFCVDSFGIQSQIFVDEIGLCENETHLQLCLKKIYAATMSHCPERLPVLQRVIAEIIVTA